MVDARQDTGGAPGAARAQLHSHKMTASNLHSARFPQPSIGLKYILTEPGCKGVWDSIACWERAEIGEVVTIPCPRVLKTVFGRNGRLFIYAFTHIMWSSSFTVSSAADEKNHLFSFCIKFWKIIMLLFYTVSASTPSFIGNAVILIVS